MAGGSAIRITANWRPVVLASVCAESANVSTSEEQLLQRAIDGDQEALRLLIKEQAAGLQQVISKQIPKRWRSVFSEDDVLQQTFADALQSIGRFVPMGEGSFGRWLADLARCNLRDALKMLGAKKRGGDRKRIDKVAVGDAHRTLLGLLASEGSSPSQHVAREEIQLAIEQAIERLPDAYRKVVQMYDIHGQTVDEVASALNRSVGAVYMLRARAHHRLHGILGATTNFFSDSA